MKEKASENIKLLNFVYQNAEMGTISIVDIEELVDNSNLENILNKQKEEYENIMDTATQIYVAYGHDSASVGAIPKISTYIMIKAKTVKNKNSDILAKMLIESSNKGIVAITKELNNNQVDDQEIIRLAQNLLEIEKQNIEDLTPFL